MLIKHVCTCPDTGRAYMVDGTVLGPSGAQYLTCTVISKLILETVDVICKRD